MQKRISAPLTLFIVAVGTSSGMCADLRAGYIKYDGVSADYSMVNGQHFICDNCPSVPKLVAVQTAQTSQPFSFPVKAIAKSQPQLAAAKPPLPLPVPITPPPAPAILPAKSATDIKPVQKKKLNVTVHFKFDSSHLSDQEKELLVQAFEGTGDSVVAKVVGHTCRIGTEKYNDKLSLRRAEEVRDFLQSFGVKVAGIEGLGSSHPLGGKLAADRRAEIVEVELATDGSDKKEKSK